MALVVRPPPALVQVRHSTREGYSEALTMIPRARAPARKIMCRSPARLHWILLIWLGS